ncbi:MAG: NfeD family protein [Acidiferrobacter sp.]
MEIGVTLAVLAGILLAIEIYSLTFYLMAAAIALAIGSAVTFMGFPADWTMGVVAIAALMGLPAAHAIRHRLSKATPESIQLAAEDTGHLVRVESISAEGLRVAYRDTVWQARLIKEKSDMPVYAGDMLQIAGRDGNDLLLTSVNDPQQAQ